MAVKTETAALSAELAAVKTQRREQLAQRWLELYGRPPPPSASPALLAMAVAYQLQANMLGGLKPSTRRRLQHAFRDSTPAPSAPLKAGTVLIREWHGVTYSVTVLDKGVQMNGRAYRSLTEVARTITGSHQSGHSFFGLKSKTVRNVRP